MFDFLRSTVPKRMQLYHHDNGDLEFVKRNIIGESATELDNTGDPKRSWIDYYQSLYPFDGYMNIPADIVQLAYSRHFHLEIHDILDDKKRPPDTDVDSMNTPFITQIAEARAMEITKAAKPRSAWEKMTWILGAALFVELLIWGISIASR